MMEFIVCVLAPIAGAVLTVKAVRWIWLDHVNRRFERSMDRWRHG